MENHRLAARKLSARTMAYPIAASVVALSAVLLWAAAASAQSSLSTDNVIVDLSVLEGGGQAGSLLQPYADTGVRLKLPPRANPVSKLHVKPKVPAAPIAAAPVKKSPPPAADKPAEPKEPEEMTASAAPPPPAEAKAEPAPMPKAAEAPAAPPPTTPPEPKVAEAPPPPPAPKAAPEPAAAPKSAAEAPQQATLSPSTELEPGRAIRVEFSETESRLPAGWKDSLKALAEAAKDKTDIRLQLMAYAGGPSLSASKARRLSLSRALSVRSFLIENGVRSTRIDVRALGNKTTEKPVNRVDIDIAKR